MPQYQVLNITYLPKREEKKFNLATYFFFIFLFSTYFPPLFQEGCVTFIHHPSPMLLEELYPL